MICQHEPRSHPEKCNEADHKRKRRVRDDLQSPRIAAKCALTIFDSDVWVKPQPRGKRLRTSNKVRPEKAWYQCIVLWVLLHVDRMEMVCMSHGEQEVELWTILESYQS
jgi:hypothetical protein